MKCWYSAKFNCNGLRYEINAAILIGNIVNFFSLAGLALNLNENEETVKSEKGYQHDNPKYFTIINHAANQEHC